MRRAVDHFELHGRFHFLIRAEEFERLVDWHLGILVAVQQEQRRVVAINVEDGTGKPRERRRVRGLVAEQAFQRGDTDVQAMRGGLLENRREFRR